MTSHSNRSENFDAPRASSPGGSAMLTVVKVLAGVGVLALLICLMLPAVRSARPAAYRNQCANNLKQVALALLNYEHTYHVLPPAYTTDSEGKPLHSWRTLILPFLEEQDLFDSIDLTKPWNDPVNAKAFNASIYFYRCPSATGADNRTSYLAVVTPESCLRAGAPRSASEITDGARKTLMLIEVDSEHAVPWMSPSDADESVVMGLGPKSELNHAGGMQSAFADGHVSFLGEDTPAGQRRALISIAGNDDASLDDGE